VKTVLKKTLVIETKKHDFINGWSYIENWTNGSLKDAFFAESNGIFKDGTLKSGATKWFVAERRCKPVDWSVFDDFESLVSVDKGGREVRIRGYEWGN
jgi:hypothetical protein